MDVLFGELVDVLGRAVASPSFSFVPVDFAFAASPSSPEHRLEDHATPLPAPLQGHFDQGVNAHWVVARLMRTFGYRPELGTVEKTLVHAALLAVPAGGGPAIPFVCADHYGNTSLWFSDAGPEAETKAAIARAFWGVLLERPTELEDFEEVVLDPGLGVWVRLGCRDGELVCEEAEG